MQDSGDLEARLLPADSALEHLSAAPSVWRPPNMPSKANGFLTIALKIPIYRTIKTSYIRLYREDDLFIGLFEREMDNELLKAVKVFTPV